MQEIGQQIANIGNRLVEERTRVGWSQSHLGMHGGVSKYTQLKYEKGETFPTADYLVRVAAYGIDVRYVLLGVRTPKHQEVITWVEDDDDAVEGRKVVFLAPELQRLVANFERSSAEGKRYLLALSAIAGGAKPTEGSATDDPALWRAVARGIPTAPNVDPNALLSPAQLLEIIEGAYELELKNRSAVARSLA